MSKIITLKVGPESVEFAVHQDVLCNASEYFSAVFKNKFKEAVENEFIFPDDSPETVARFVQFVYTQNIHFTEEERSGLHLPWKELIDLFFYGDLRGSPGFMDCILKAFRDKARTVGKVPIEIVALIYECSPENSPLRTAVVKNYAFLSATETLSEKRRVEAGGDLGPAEFYWDLAQFLKKTMEKYGFME